MALQQKLLWLDGNFAETLGQSSSAILFHLIDNNILKERVGHTILYYMISLKSLSNNSCKL